MADVNLNEMRATIERLAELFPRAIFVYEARRRPLKIGIHLDIVERLGAGVIPTHELSAALGLYTRNNVYLSAVARPGARIDLDGAPAGAVTPAAAAVAAKDLADRLLLRPIADGPEVERVKLVRESVPDHLAPAPGPKAFDAGRICGCMPWRVGAPDQSVSAPRGAGFGPEPFAWRNPARRRSGPNIKHRERLFICLLYHSICEQKNARIELSFFYLFGDGRRILGVR